MSILSFINKDKEENSILVDIGNGVITGSIVSFARKDLPNILYIKKVSFPIDEKPSKKRLVDSLEKFLDIVLKDVLKNGLKITNIKKIEKVLVTFSDPWFLIKSKEINISKDKNFFITESLLNSISENESKRFQEESIKELPKNVDDSFSIIEKIIVNTKINGYQYSNPIGKKTKVFSTFLCMSLIPKSVEEKVLDSIQKNTHIQKEKIIAHSFPLVLFSVIRDHFMHSSSFVTMDITSELTSLTLVSGDTIVVSTSFPLGRNYIIRKIAEKSDVSTEIAESSFKLYTAKRLDDSMYKSINDTVLDIEKEWSIYFEDALLSLSNDLALPKTIFITGEEDVYSLFSEFIKIEKTDKTDIYRKGAIIVELTDTTLSHLYKKDFVYESDDFIAIESVFYSKIINKNL